VIKQKVLVSTLCLALIAPAVPCVAGQKAQASAEKPAPVIKTQERPGAAPEGQQPESVRPGSTSERRDNQQRDYRPRRHHSHISKGEVIFMAGIAGTSMGIGAIAAGGTGLAIGAIVGGWGAYAGHRIWHWVK
jgi:hypothetical protein